MAWTPSPIYRATIVFRDLAMRKAQMDFCILKSFAGVTEATARAKVLSVASACQAISNAGVQSTILRDEEWDLSQTPAAPGTPYPNVEDRAQLRIQPVPSAREIPILLPAPKANVFVAGNVDIVDRTNTHLQDMLSFLATKAFDYGYEALVTYAGGERFRSSSKLLRKAMPLLLA